MSKGRKLSDQLKREILAALATRIDVSVPVLAKEFGVHPITLYKLSGEHKINRPQGAGAPSHANKCQTARRLAREAAEKAVR